MTTTTLTTHGGTMNPNITRTAEVVTDPTDLPIHPRDGLGVDLPRRRRRGRGEEPTPALAAALERRRSPSWFPTAIR